MSDLSIAQFVPYANYVATAVEIVQKIYNFGRESDTDKAIRLLKERGGAPGACEESR